jgi:hypothetical protein
MLDNDFYRREIALRASMKAHSSIKDFHRANLKIGTRLLLFSDIYFVDSEGYGTIKFCNPARLPSQKVTAS